MIPDGAVGEVPGGGPPHPLQRQLKVFGVGEMGGACAQGVVHSPAWEAHLQEGCPVASHPVLRRVPRPVSPSLSSVALLSSPGMSGPLYMKGKRPAWALNPPDERKAST